ncbi:MAG: cytochrome C [Planctomycetota bacterium]
MNRPHIWRGIGVLAALSTIGCADPAQRADFFALPAGNATAGQEVFMKMRCYDCHDIPGVDLPLSEESDQVQVVLGGKVAKVKTYNDLVTSIINPSHRLSESYTTALVSRDGESNMTNYNDVMTISELIDLVAFLQTQYKVVEPMRPSYPPYY